jgi:DNA polymerase
VDDGEAKWYDGKSLPLVLASFNWDEVHFVAHNTLFDGAILQWYYQHKPAFWYDTMGMAQALLSQTCGGAALKKIAHVVGRGKDSQALLNMRGVRSADIDKTSPEWARYTTYANEDTLTCRDVFRKLKPLFPKKELLVIDTLLRMYFDNKLVLDGHIIGKSLAEIRANAEAHLRRVGVPDKSMLRSRDTFAKLLRSHGVTPPVKVSPANGEQTYAFAKNDLEFVKLLEHEDPKVVALVEAKLEASSSLEETRAKRFQNLAHSPGSLLHVPLRYSAAHTHRFGGSDNLNLQNLPRNSPLRASIKAPDGYKLVVVDASQIEARMLAWLAGCTSLVQAFAKGEDVYSSFASSIYNIEVNKKDHPDYRFVGKTGILGLGYGTGHAKFQWSLLTSPFYDGDAPEDFCQKVVQTYRTKYPEIPRFWRKMDEMLITMTMGNAKDIVGPLVFGNKHVMLPSGLPIQYPQLHYVEGEDYMSSGYEYYSARYKGFKKIYGAALTENVTQALSRIVITDAMLMMRVTDPDYFCCLQVHDELGYLVREEKADACYAHLMKYMTTRPSWAPDLPLAAEGGIGVRYSDVK